MKPTFAIFLLILVFTSARSQELPEASDMKDFYLTKSRDQRSTAWVMAGAGTALAVGGLAVQLYQELGYSFYQVGPRPKNTALIFSAVGLASALGSIPVFISAGKNKRKAASLSFDVQKYPAQFVTCGRLPINQLGVKFRVSL